MKGQTDPFVQQKMLLCLLCLFWNGSLVQSTINTSVPLTIIPEPAHGNNDFQGPSADAQLISFQEECVAHVIHAIRDGGHHTELRCSLESGLSYSIPSADEKWINEQMVLGELISAETILRFPPETMLNQYTHKIHMSEPPKLWNYELEERERRRKLRRHATIGIRTVLVVRIQATDNTTTPTAAALRNHVFGDDGSDYNFKYQTEACSFNQLTINKASARTGTSASISNGITTVSVNIPATSGEMPMQNAVTVALNSEFGVGRPSELADHVMYCFPTGTTSQIAYGEVGGYLSFYNDESCTYPSTVMHEIGHNFNMGHSSDSEDEYGDKSGVMGNVYWYTWQPKMCFNAAKSWQLGWYNSKADSISPSPTSATYSTKLSGIVDYSKTSNSVLLEIRQSTSPTHFYLNFNRAKGINSGTQECKDRVCIVSKDTSVETNLSVVLAALESGQSYMISNFNGKSGGTLTITVTSLNRKEARVDIALTGFSDSPSSTPSVSESPSTMASATPSLTPSKSRFPSNIPSNVPSVGPSLTPSKVESKFPSTEPSNKPSAIFSAPPSKIPSETPSIPVKLMPLPRFQSPSATTAPSVSEQPSSKPSGVDQPSSNVAPSEQPSGAPVPGTLLQLVEDSIFNVPQGPIPVERTATSVVNIGVDGLTELEQICNGIESFLAQGIQAAFASTDTQTNVECTRPQSIRRTKVATTFLVYEKPTYVTVTTLFADFRQAPRQVGFGVFLEDLIDSEDAQNQLPQYIQQALDSDSEGIYVRMSENQGKPVLVVGFGDNPPTPSPTVSPTAEDSDGTTETSAGFTNTAYVVPLGVASLVVAIAGLL